MQQIEHAKSYWDDKYSCNVKETEDLSEYLSNNLTTPAISEGARQVIIYTYREREREREDNVLQEKISQLISENYHIPLKKLPYNQRNKKK